MEGEYLERIMATCLAALRIAPLFAFSAPFTLIRVPGLVRGTLVVALAAALVGLAAGKSNMGWQGSFVAAAASELTVGIAMALVLQLAFTVIAIAGRSLDIQAGFGLAFVVDPTTKAQMPLIGSLFTYAAAAIFFATDGPADLLAVLAASFEALPLGAAIGPGAIQHVIAYLGVVSVLALGVAGLGSTVLLLIDLTVAMMSRTLPQMNMLVLGFQVKAIVALLVLPATLSLAAGVMLSILRLAIEAMAGIV